VSRWQVKKVEVFLEGIDPSASTISQSETFSETSENREIETVDQNGHIVITRRKTSRQFPRRKKKRVNMFDGNSSLSASPN